MSENGEIYTAGKNFTLPPALTALTNSTSVKILVSSFSVSKERSRKFPQIQNHIDDPWNYFFLICENKTWLQIFPNPAVNLSRPVRKVQDERTEVRLGQMSKLH